MAKLLQQKEIFSDSIVEEPTKKETLIKDESNEENLFDESSSKIPPYISQDVLDRLRTLSIKKSASNSSNENSFGKVLNNGAASSNSNVSSASVINSNYTSCEIYNEDEDFNLALYLQEEENVCYLS